jgi:glycosyltransferase involved in cell wall biosynthesis
VIYVCIAAQNETGTVGLVLWKLRKVFEEFPREYHILAADDGSTDGTAQTLEAYRRALPMEVLRQERPRGFAAALDALLRDALGRSDRPKRDCVVTLPADFSISPDVLPELVRRFESGADVVVGETAPRERSLGMRLVQRSAAWLLRPGLSLPGIRDLTSGACLIRLITLRNCLKERTNGLLETEGAAAFPELVARAAAAARQIAAVEAPAHPEALTPPTSGRAALALARDLFQAGRRLRIPPPTATVVRP